MSRSKAEVDNFITSFRRKAKSEQEIQLRGFQFATFYWEAREYVLGIKWTQSYLAVKHNDDRAHKLLGNLYEGVKDYGKAIDCYKKSLELNDTQRELILRIASLGCTIPNYDVEKLRYWVERAERFYPTHINVHKIKENIFRRSGKLPDYEIYLRNKLAQRKGDYYLNCKLVKLLIEMKRLREAVDHILLTQDLESVADQPIWWESTVQTLEIYIKSIRQGEEKTSGEETIMEMHSHLLMALCKWIMLSLAMMDKPPHNAVVLLKGLDQCLLRANSLKMNSNWDYVLNEMASQLYYLMGLHLCRMAAMASFRWSDIIVLVTCCFVQSAHVKLPDMSGRSEYETKKWTLLSSARLSEVTHMLHAFQKQYGPDWLEKCHRATANLQSQTQLFHVAFGQEADPNKSYFMTNTNFVKVQEIILDDLVGVVLKYDQDAVLAQPHNLQLLVWLGLQWDVRKDGISPDLGTFIETSFDKLHYSSNNLKITSVDNLRLLDIEAFLYLLVKAAKGKNESLRADGRTDKNQPVILPVPLCQMLFTEEQEKWFKSVCALYSGNAKSEERAKMRLSIQKGLEAIRNADQFNIDTPLLIHLARTFRARMLEEKKENDVPGNEQFLACQRLSVHYWQAASEHLKLLASDKALSPPKHTFFVASPDKIKKEDMTSLQEEAAVALAEYEFQQGRHQQALNLLSKVKGVTGLFTKALMCKQLCHMEVEGKNDGEITADMILAQGTYLDQCTYSLYSAMDTIQDDHNNSMHEEIQSLLDDVDVEKQQLAHKGVEDGGSIDTSCRFANGNNARSSVGRISVSSRTSMDGRSILHSAGDMSSFQQGLSPDPSPRRLMSELRSMNVSQTRLMDENSQLRTLALSHSRLLEQNSEILSKHNEVMEQNKFLMEQIINLNKEMQELKLNVPPPPHLATPHVPSASSRANESSTINTDNTIVINANNCRIEKAEAPNLTTPQPVMYYPTHPTVFPPQLIPSFNLTGFPIPGMAGAEQPCMPSMMTSTPGQRYHGEDAYEAESDIYGIDPHSTIPSLKLREGQVFSTPTQVIGQSRTPEIGTPSDAVHNDEGFARFSGLNTIHPKTFTGTPVMPGENLAGIKTFNYQPKLNLQSVSSPVAPSLSKSEPAPEKSASDAPLLRQILIGSEDSAEQPSPQTFSGFPSLSSTSRFNHGGGDKLSERAAVSPNFTSGTRLESAKAKEAEQTPTSVAGFSFGSKPEASSNPPPAPSGFTGFSFGGGSNFTPVSSQPVSTSSNVFNKPSSTLFSQPQSTFGSQSTASPVSGPFSQTATGAFKGLNFAAQKEPISTSPFAGFSFTTQKTPVAAAPQPRKPGQSPLLAGQEAAVDSSATQTKDESGSDNESDDDVIVVYERKPTPAQIAMALKLRLPPTFYLYEYKEPCPGCIGCYDIDIAELFNKENRFSTDDQRENSTKAKEESVQPSQETLSTAPLMFGGSNASSVTFASISAETNSTPDFMKQKTFQSFSWSSAGTQLFTSPGGADTEYDPHYEPIVTLPEVTDIKTGEEDETCLWKERGKLYRFNKDLNQWKERGVGDIKFMQNKNTGRIRILMRREQVLKVCANHVITPDIELKTMQSSDRAWVWNALDFSEGKASREQLAIRFKKPEVASEFKNKFEECKQLAIETEKTGPVKKVEEKKEETEVKSLAEKFKPKPGSWNCDTCLVSNPPGTVKCLACATPKPGVAPTTQATTSTPSQTQPASATGGFRFEGTISSPQTSRFTFGGSDSDKPSQNSGFTFGQAFGGSQPQTTSGFSFGSSKPTGSFSFGGESTKVASSTQQKLSSPPAVATTTNDADKKDKTTSLSEMFKPKAGVWSCPTCLCQNTAEHKKCPACQTRQPGAQPEASSSFASSTTSSSFKFGNTSLEQLLGKSDSNGQPSTTAPTKVYATSPAPAKTFSFGQAGKSLPQFTFGGGDVSGAVSNPPASTGFTFGAPKPPSAGFVFGSNLNQNAAEEQALDLSSPKKTPDQGCKFSEMAKSFTFQFKMDPEEAANAPPKSPTKSPGIQRSPGLMKSPCLDKSGDDSYYKDDDYDGLHFEPVVHLDPVELTTGEENEDVMFCHRAKLYRFNKESNEWKERGMGDIKIMKHKETGLYRILMRREQVLKLCANHFIQPEMDLRPNSGSDRSWVWTAMDASDDGNVKPELLAVRFKTSDVAAAFKEAFENAKEAVIKIKGSNQAKPTEKEIDDKSKEVKNEDTEEIKTDQVEKKSTEEKGDTQVEEKDNEEEDDDDDDDNEEDDEEEEEEQNEEEDKEEKEAEVKEEYKEDEENKVEDEEDDKVEEEEGDKVVEEEGDKVVEEEENKVVEEEGDKVVEEEGDKVVEEEENKVEEEEDDKVVEEEGNEVEEKEDDKVEEGDDKLEEEDDKVEEEDDEVEEEDDEEEDDKVEEAEDNKVEEAEDKKAEDEDKKAEDEDKDKTQADSAVTSAPTFSFGQSFAAAVRKTMSEDEKSEPSTASSPAKASVRSSDQGYYPEEERDDLQFEPVVTLKEIEVKTGEEEEEQLFCQRAKLYRWNRETAQWKERGVGEIKILKHKVLNRCRVVMRRDQVLKICANHIITPEMELKPNAGSDRSLVWNAMDASDMEPQLEQLAVKFKTPAITAGFKAVFEKCQGS